MLRNRWAWLFTLAVMLLAWPRSASAHADLIRSDPAADGLYPTGSLKQARLYFDEVLEPTFSSIEIYNSRLERVDEGELWVDPTDPRSLIVDLIELEPDIYTVIWRVVSRVDSHSTRGLFRFTVGSAVAGDVSTNGMQLPSDESSSRAWEIVFRWLSFVAAFIVFGALLIRLVILKPVRQTSRINAEMFWFSADRNIDKLIIAAVVVWLSVGIAVLGLQSAAVGRVGLVDALERDIPQQLLGTRFGIIWVFRQFLAFVILFTYRRRPVLQSTTDGKRNTIRLALAAAMLGTLSLTSHGAAVPLWPALAAAVDWLHLLANGAWVGGLLVLSLVFIPLLNRLSRDHWAAVLRPTLRRFSFLALVSVILSGATGVYSASLHFLSPPDLIQTAYGQTFILKLLLALWIMGLGLVNMLTLRSGWLRSFPFISIWLASSSKNFRHLLPAEALLGILILGATAVLTALPTPPPRPLDWDSTPFNSELREVYLPDNQIKAFLALAPNYIGWNRYMVVLNDAGGNPVDDAERVRVRFYLPKAEARTDWVKMAHSAGGLYVAQGQDLVLEGDWSMEVDVRRSGTADVRFTVNWPMAPPPTVQVDPAQPRLANWLTLATLIVSLVGLSVWNLRRHLSRNDYLDSPCKRWLRLRNPRSSQIFEHQNAK